MLLLNGNDIKPLRQNRLKDSKAILYCLCTEVEILHKTCTVYQYKNCLLMISIRKRSFSVIFKNKFVSADYLKSMFFKLFESVE